MPKLVYNKKGIALLIMEPGDLLYVRHIVGPTVDKFGDLSDADGGSKKITFHHRAVIYVQDIITNLKTCKHLRFAREIEGERTDFLSFYKPFPALRAALLRNHIQGIKIPGGLQYALKYPDEVIVPFNDTCGWIVKKSDVKGLLKTIPQKTQKAEAKKR